MLVAKILCLVAITFTCTIDAQAVHVVDASNNPGTDFLSLNAAVAAASSGDMLLIREGDYSNEAVFLDGRGLILQGELGALVTLATITLSNLPAGEFFAARNLTVQAVFGISQTGIRATDCMGSIWFEDIHVLKTRAFSGDSVCLQNCSQAVLIRCQIDAGVLGSFYSSRFIDSEVHLFDCSVEGAVGVQRGLSSAPGDGAVLMQDGELFLYGSRISGGNGGDATFGGLDGTAGGPGLTLDGTNPVLHILDSTIVGGQGGAADLGGSMGASGADIVQNAPNAMLISEAGTMRSFEVSSPVRELGNLTIAATGQAGERVLVSTPDTPGPTYTSPNFCGAAVVPLLPIIALGSLAVSGPQTLTQTIGQLAPGQEFEAIFAQAYFFGTKFTVSTPTLTIFLDEAF